MNDKKVTESSKIFICKSCNYSTSRESQFNRHNLTTKHKNMTNDDNKVLKNPRIYECNCGNIYKYRQGLCSHRKKCMNTPTIKIEGVKNDINASIVLEIMKENQEFKNMLIEQHKTVVELQTQIVEITKESKTTTITTNNNNNTNNQFNLNFFLNETCKNALNFSEFIENIQISSDDLENNVKMGFVNGISKLIMDNLKQLELSDRPIHCTDAKRETIYVKEEEQWEKDHSKDVIQKGIQEITRKNMCQLMEWREDNPEYQDIESELGEQSILMQQNSMAGPKRDEFYPRIIKNIAKDTILDKKMVLE